MISEDQPTEGELPSQTEVLSNSISKIDIADLKTFCENKWRVKVFCLNSEGSWDESGIGHIKIILLSDEGYILFAESEQDKDTLLESKIKDSTIYQRQRDTIITWLEEDIDNEIAISFQDVEGANETWNIVCTIQGKDPELEGTDPQCEDKQEEASPKDVLPPPNMQNLLIIQEELAALSPLHQKERYIKLLQRNNFEYLERLSNLFTMAEDLESVEYLSTIFLIFKHIINMGDTYIIEEMMTQKYYINIFGALEYNPDQIHSKNRVLNREFLKNGTKFINIVGLEEEEILRKVHQTYRLQFLKDTAAASWLDEGVLAAIQHVITMNNFDIIFSIFDNPNSVPQIISKLSSETMSIRLDCLQFLNEICVIAKRICFGGKPEKEEFFNMLCRNSLFSLLIDLFVTNPEKSDDKSNNIQNIEKNENNEDDEEKIRKAMENNLESDCLLMTGAVSYISAFNNPELIKINVSEILVSLISIVPDSVVKYISEEKDDEVEEKFRLIDILLDAMFWSVEDGVKLEISELVKLLFESGLKRTEAMQEMLAVVVNKLISFLDDNNTKGYVSIKELGFSKHLTLEILTYLARNNFQRVKYLILHDQLLQTILKMLNWAEKYVRLSALRFFRSAIMHKDEGINTYIVQGSLFETIFQLFEQNKNRNDMISSSVLEIIDFITKENVKSLINHVMEKYELIVKKEWGITGLNQQMKMLDLKYQQNHESYTADDDINSVHKQPIPGINSCFKEKDDLSEEDFLGSEPSEGEQEANHTALLLLKERVNASRISPAVGENEGNEEEEDSNLWGGTFSKNKRIVFEMGSVVDQEVDDEGHLQHSPNNQNAHNNDNSNNWEMDLQSTVKRKKLGEDDEYMLNYALDEDHNCDL